MVNIGYQRDDERIVDYDLWRIEGIDVDLRGPKLTIEPGKYVAAIGAAQTFGRFVPNPFPNLLSKRLEYPVLNLGCSGAGPSFFIQRPRLINIINKSSLAIIQILSGRSISNSMFEVQGNQGVVRPIGKPDSKPTFAEVSYRDFLENSSSYEAARLRAEIRWRYIKEMCALMSSITVPKILLFFSSRKVDYQESLHNLAGFWGGFPHFVNRAVVNALVPFADAYVEVATDRGLPQPLNDKLNGAPVEVWPEKLFPHVKHRHHNHYYPSPEMHAEASEALAAPCVAALKGKTLKTPTRNQEVRTGRKSVFIHMHIFKNAGTSLDTILASSFGSQFQTLDPPDAGSIYLESDICDVLHKRPDLLALSSHQLRPPFLGDMKFRLLPYLLVRHPIDRIHSVYEYERSPGRQNTSTIPITKWAAELSFASFIVKCFSFKNSQGLVSNYQTRVLSQILPTRQEHWQHVVDEEDLLSALRFLDTLPSVGVVERFADSLAHLERTYSRIFPQLGTYVLRVNKSREVRPLDKSLKTIESELGPSVYERLIAANALDLELYRIANKKLPPAVQEF